MSMSFVEAEVDYAENDSVKESLADDEDDNSLYHDKKIKKIIVKTGFFPFVSLFLISLTCRILFRWMRLYFLLKSKFVMVIYIYFDKETNV